MNPTSLISGVATLAIKTIPNLNTISFTAVQAKFCLLTQVLDPYGQPYAA